MISIISRGVWGSWLASFLFFWCSSSSVKAFLHVVQIKNIGAESTFFSGSIQNDRTYNSSMDRSFSAGEAYSGSPGTYSLYWDDAGYSAGQTCTVTISQTAPSGGTGTRVYTFTKGLDDNYLHVMWQGPAPAYVPIRLINDSAYTVKVGVVVKHGAPETASHGGPSIAPAGSTEEFCFGPFSTPPGDWWVYTMTDSFTVLDGMTLTNTVGSNLIYYAAVAEGWRTNCSNPTPIRLSGASWNSNAVPQSGAVDWNSTNITAQVNTNLDVSTVNQIGFNNLLSALDRLMGVVQSSGGGGGGGTGTNIDYSSYLQMLTNQMRALTNDTSWNRTLSSNMLWMSTNEWFGATNSPLFGASLFGPEMTQRLEDYSNTVHFGLSQWALVLSDPAPGETLPENTFSFPGIGGYAIPLNVPWAGGSPADDSNIAINGQMWVWLRQILAVVLVVALWARVYQEMTESWWNVIHTQQMQVAKGNVLGVSLAMPASFAVCAVLIAVLFAVPTALLAAATTAGVPSVATVADSVGGAAAIGAESGLWGLVMLAVPWSAAWSAIASYLTWRFTRDAITTAVSAMVKANLTD